MWNKADFALIALFRFYINKFTTLKIISLLLKKRESKINHSQTIKNIELFKNMFEERLKVM